VGFYSHPPPDLASPKMRPFAPSPKTGRDGSSYITKCDTFFATV
jgi:hypothetical protein